jgi:hypothetical protein
MASAAVLPDCSPLSRTIAPVWDRGSKQMLLVNPSTQPLCVIHTVSAARCPHQEMLHAWVHSSSAR